MINGNNNPLEKIHQLAENIRQELVVTVRERDDTLKEKLEQLKQQIEQARQDGGYYENDLRDWTEKINILRSTFVEQQSIKLGEENGLTPFISRISLQDPFQNDTRGGKQHPDVRQNPYDDYSNTPNQHEYSTGRHTIRYKIERYDETSSVIFGIVSKNSGNYPEPYNNPTFFGWRDKNLVYLGGVPEDNYSGYPSYFQSKDIYVLTIDCTNQRISLTNERTTRSTDLDVNLKKCPFPWQLSVRLFSDSLE